MTLPPGSTDTDLKRVEMLREWKRWVKIIAAEAKKILPDTKVYVVGSIVRGDYTGGSDVDIIIVSDRVPENALRRAAIKARIEDAINLPYYHPFEIHLLRPEEAQHYLKKNKIVVEAND